MDKINVVWLSYHKPEIIARGYWDNGLLESIFKTGEYRHHEDFEWKYQDKGAIVIINGRTHIEDKDYEDINADIAKLKWVLFIDTGDEEAVFQWRNIKHPRMRVWVMMPRINQHDDVSYYIPNGYRPETRDMLREIGCQDKTQDWYFCGQKTHERREQCVAELEFFIDSGQFPNGKLVSTDHFGATDVDYKTYMSELSKTKIAPCPSGPESPDSFRLYEALEAGCLPIVDAFSTNNRSPGFWNYMFRGSVPFPIVDYWDTLNKDNLMSELLKGYPENANRCFAWWQLKKREIRFKLEDDIKELSK